MHSTRLEFMLIAPKRQCKNWDFEIGGSFAGRDCTIVDCTRKIVAQMGKKELMGGKDFYHVEVQSGYDQAFIIGVMAILDSIHGERHGTNRRHLKLSKADASRGYLLSGHMIDA
ncbi:hypothetical protein ZEAMMB73_Zm00001d025914 [Zea mays]|uniref:Protein LURP-one-related 6 n=1 Tax=Zea mays TaxID=4577 RepID=A0A1D6JAT4_MAIZE|nr:hypothetical protein ZEAMMB73_Zm00001d025914 [Zea mays]AQK45002.1 hypothetical protein ZEAMMB73_Zm00001d025914 [Zea mays]